MPQAILTLLTTGGMLMGCNNAPAIPEESEAESGNRAANRTAQTPATEPTATPYPTPSPVAAEDTRETGTAAPFGWGNFLTWDEAYPIFVENDSPVRNLYHLDTDGDTIPCNAIGQFKRLPAGQIIKTFDTLKSRGYATKDRTPQRLP